MFEWDIFLGKIAMEASKSYRRQLELWERKNAEKRQGKEKGERLGEKMAFIVKERNRLWTKA